MAPRLIASLIALLAACAAPKPATNTPTDSAIRCFEVDLLQGAHECNSTSRLRITGCFVEGGVDIDYEFDIDECEPGEEEAPPLLGHGDLEWHGRLGAAWADDLERLLMDGVAVASDGDDGALKVIFEDGSVKPVGNSGKGLWRFVMIDFEEIVEQAAGLGSPPPITMIAKGAVEERFELRRRPADHVADFVWTDGERSGRCEIDGHVVWDIFVAFDEVPGPDPSAPCPDGDGYFVFMRSGEREVCEIWTRAKPFNHRRVIDPRLGEVPTAIGETLALLRSAVKSCGG